MVHTAWTIVRYKSMAIKWVDGVYLLAILINSF